MYGILLIWIVTSGFCVIGQLQSLQAMQRLIRHSSDKEKIIRVDDVAGGFAMISLHNPTVASFARRLESQASCALLPPLAPKWDEEKALAMANSMRYGTLYRYLQEHASVERRGDEGSRWELEMLQYNVPPAYLFFIEQEIVQLKRQSMPYSPQILFCLAQHIMQFLFFVHIDVTVCLLRQESVGVPVLQLFKEYFKELLQRNNISLRHVSIGSVINVLKNSTQWFGSFTTMFPSTWILQAFESPGIPFGDCLMSDFSGKTIAQSLEQKWGIEQRIVRLLLGEFIVSEPSWITIRNRSVEDYLTTIGEFDLCGWREFLIRYWEHTHTFVERVKGQRYPMRKFWDLDRHRW